MTKTGTYLASLWMIAILLSAVLFAENKSTVFDECVVCRIQRLDHRKKTIVSQSRYKDQDYLFCSDSCKAQFDNNPEFFIEPPVPRRAPEFTLTTLSGNQDSLANYRERVLLIDFWASWCAPCVKTMKELESIYNEFRSDSLVIIGITLDSIGNQQTVNHIARNEITYPILFENRVSPTWLAYQVKSIPSLYLVNRDGQIVRQWRGASEKGEVEAAVRALFVKPVNR